jgi:hypothetical protein
MATPTPIPDAVTSSPSPKWNPTSLPTGTPSLVKGWPKVTQDGITMAGGIEETSVSADAAIGAAPAIVISISMTGLEPGAQVTLLAAGRYDFPVLGCGIEPSPCTPGSDTTDPSVQLCRPAYEVQNVSGTARDTVQTVADPNGSATSTVNLVAGESLESCPVDAALPWYGLSGAWTKIRVTDAEHGLRLLPEDVVSGP